MMKKIYLILLLCIPALAFAGLSVTPGTPAHTHSDANTGGGTLTVSGTLSSTKACEVGYSRVVPNLCWRGGTAMTAATRDTCDAVAMPSSDAKAIVYLFRTEPRTANAILRRYTQMVAYDDATCVGTTMAFQDSSQYEEVAKVAGTQLGDMAAQHIAPVPTGTPRVKMQDDAGNQGIGWYRIVGYYD
jgi:hypothetical protein